MGHPLFLILIYQDIPDNSGDKERIPKIEETFIFLLKYSQPFSFSDTMLSKSTLFSLTCKYLQDLILIQSIELTFTTIPRDSFAKWRSYKYIPHLLPQKTGSRANMNFLYFPPIQPYSQPFSVVSSTQIICIAHLGTRGREYMQNFRIGMVPYQCDYQRYHSNW